MGLSAIQVKLITCGVRTRTRGLYGSDVGHYARVRWRGGNGWLWRDARPQSHFLHNAHRPRCCAIPPQYYTIVSEPPDLGAGTTPCAMSSAALIVLHIRYPFGTEQHTNMRPLGQTKKKTRHGWLILPPCHALLSHIPHHVPFTKRQRSAVEPPDDVTKPYYAPPPLRLILLLQPCLLR